MEVSDDSRSAQREIHHRVKNNLQLISSLVDLQLAHAGEKSGREMIEAIQGRIRSMAHLQENSLKDSSLDRVEIQTYLHSFIRQLELTFPDQRQIEFRLERAQFSIDVIIPVGLIVNELITNSIKHAASAGEKTKISILGEKTGDQYMLRISDSGPGFDFIQESGGSTLGLKLVRGLAGQIRATINQFNENGSIFIITFPLDQH